MPGGADLPAETTWRPRRPRGGGGCSRARFGSVVPLRVGGEAGRGQDGDSAGSSSAVSMPDTFTNSTSLHILLFLSISF